MAASRPPPLPFPGQPPTGAGRDPSVVVGRARGTVVVTVDGELGPDGCGPLEGVLTDLIEGQGNLTVEVDLGGAVVEPEALAVFVSAAHGARRHGARFILREPPTDAHEVLQAGELGDVVEILPRRTGDANPWPA